jgi:hypothetical protein
MTSMIRRDPRLSSGVLVPMLGWLIPLSVCIPACRSRKCALNMVEAGIVFQLIFPPDEVFNLLQMIPFLM